MIKEAIEKIVEMSGIQIRTANGIPYRSDSMEELPYPEKEPDTVEMHTLSGFCEYVMKDIDNQKNDDDHKLIVLVGGHDHVSLVTGVFGDFNQRFTYAEASPYTGRQFRFGQYIDIESFIVDLQSCFVQDEMTANVLKVVGNITSEIVTTVVDDGVGQQVSAKVGIARVANVVLPNPVMLRPFRTFQEVEQPVSRFVLRLKRGTDGQMPTAALFESSDDQWKLEAVKSIKKYILDSDCSLTVLA